MIRNGLMSKSTFILVVFLIAAVTATEMGKKHHKPWSDKWCHKFNHDGTLCLECSYRCYMNKYGKCHPVSDHCKQWDPCTGLCTCCYPGYGEPKHGICPSTPKKSIPIEKPVDKYCAEYCWMDSHKKIYAEWFKGCVKVCKCCVKGYYLDCDNICVKLPKHCEEAYPDGTCKCCKKGYELCQGKCVREY